MSVAVQPDVAGDLRRVHAVITRALAVSMQYCDTPADRLASDADPSTHDRFFTYVEALAGLLHAHHLVEDEVAFPYVRQLIPEMPYERLAAEHQQVAVALAHISPAIATGRVADPEDARHRIREILAEMVTVWHPHIEQEERHLTRDRFEQVMSPEDQASLSESIGAHSQAHAKPDHLVLPFMLYNLPAAERAVMASRLPPVVTEHLVPVVWEPQWSRMRPFLLDQ